MGDNHLSEVCKTGTDVEPILERLRLLAPLPRYATENENNDNDSENDIQNEENEDKREENVNPTSSSPSNNYDSSSSSSFSPFRCNLNYRDSDGRTALHWAIALRNYGLASALLRAPYYANPITQDEDLATPLLTACMVNAPDVFLEELCGCAIQAYRANPHALILDPDDTSKKNPPPTTNNISESTATQNDSPSISPSGNALTDAELQAYLLNLKDSAGNTALLYTSGRGYHRVVKWLLRHGADASVQNRRGQSALHRSVSSSSTETVEELVAAVHRLFSQQQGGGDAEVKYKKWVNLPDKEGNTALFYASMDNNEDLGRYLLRHGADRNVRNKEGKEFWQV